MDNVESILSFCLVAPLSNGKSDETKQWISSNFDDRIIPLAMQMMLHSGFHLIRLNEQHIWTYEGKIH